MEIKHLISDYSGDFKNAEHVEKGINALSNALCELKEEHPYLYVEIFRHVYAELNGEHYNEHLSKHDVGKMFHKKSDDTEVKGEHFPLEKAREAMQMHGIDGDNTVYDVYVAINTNYHDKYKQYISWFPADCEKNH